MAGNEERIREYIELLSPGKSYLISFLWLDEYTVAADRRLAGIFLRTG